MIYRLPALNIFPHTLLQLAYPYHHSPLNPISKSHTYYQSNSIVHCNDQKLP